MADNSTLPATGDVIAADDIGGVKYQRVKPAFGVDGSATDVSATNPLPIVTPDSQSSITGTLSANGTLFTTDALNYATLICDVQGVYTAQVKFQTSIDNTNWTDIQCYPVDMELCPKDILTEDGMVVVPVIGRYIRAVVQGYQNGTVTATAILRQQNMDAFCTANLAKALDDKEGVELRTRVVGSAARDIRQDPISGAIQTYQDNTRIVVPIDMSVVNVVCADIPTYSAMSAYITTGTYAGGQPSVEGLFPDGWRSLTGVQGSAATFSGGLLSAAVHYVMLAGAERIRIRVTTASAGVKTNAVIQLSSQLIPHAIPIISGYGQAVPTSVNSIASAVTLADSFANPTTGHLASDAFQFNGTSWDRARNNAIVTMGDTGAKTATFNGATQTNYNSAGAIITVAVGTVSGTSPTLTAQLQVSYDGTNFLNYGPASTAITATGTIMFVVYPSNMTVAGATPAALTTGATQTVVINSPLPRTWRLAYTIGGTTPSFTFTNAYAAYIL